MTLLGYTKKELSKDFDYPMERLLEEAKDRVLGDFTDKLCDYYGNSRNMIPNSLILYTIFYNKYGFDDATVKDALNECKSVSKGLKIETQEILELAHHKIKERYNGYAYCEEIRRWFGKGEFPFLNTFVYVFDDYVIFTYTISR